MINVYRHPGPTVATEDDIDGTKLSDNIEGLIMYCKVAFTTR